MAKTCFGCGHPVNGYGGKWKYCQACLPIVQKLQAITGNLVRKAGMRINPGRICAVCSTRPAAVFDHRHYSKPYEVQAVCMRCNNMLGPANDVPRLIAAWRKIFR